jgi:FkbM family methyltransferase
VPAKYAFYQYLRKRYPQSLVTYVLDDGRLFCLPVSEWCFWLELGPQNYYLDEFTPFCELINRQAMPFTFFDLGADIGTVSSLIESHCPALEAVFAFEPNPGSYAILNYNLAQFKGKSQSVNLAVSDFTGKVQLSTANADTGDHEGHINPLIEGTTEVSSLDAWIAVEQPQLANLVVLKIDVEGQEIATIHGAKGVIQQTRKIIVLVEIHPEVLAQWEQTAEDIFMAMEALREVVWLVPKLNNAKVDRNLAFFKQFPKQQYDVIGIAK